MRRILTTTLLSVALMLGAWSTASAQFVMGGSGPDTLYGSSGSDHLRGGRGADILIGKGGADVLRGGTGWDTCYVSPGDLVFSCEDIRQHR